MSPEIGQDLLCSAWSNTIVIYLGETWGTFTVTRYQQGL